MKLWMLFILGTIAFFLKKFINRSDKTNPSLGYYIKHNWARLAYACVFNLATMIVVNDASTSIDLQSFLDKLPIVATVSAKLLFSFLSGYGIGLGAYSIGRRKLTSNETKC